MAYRLRGPSPHAWGLLRAQRQVKLERRSIPTRVGTTTAEVTARIELLGPSPHAWGLHEPGTAQRDVLRSIPTRVGTTSVSVWTPGRTTVHPHTRGDYT